MTPPPELLLTTCPCGCRAPVLVAAVALAAGVTCPTTRRRYAVPAGVPLKVRFGRKQYAACADVRLLRQAWQFASPKPTTRKKRLAALRVAETCLHWCKNATFRRACAVAAELADAGTTGEDRVALSEEIAPAAFSAEQLDPWRLVGLRLLEADPALDYGPLEATDPLRVAAAVREVLPNPFRPTPVRPEWLTSTVVGLADAVHARQTYVDLPILADAFEEAGCADWPLLDHLRAGVPHGRGCWALDVVRGRV